MTDKELIKGCENHDRRCQNELYKKYFPLMSSVAIRYTADKDEAVHKINSGFLKILQNLSKYNSQFALATFIRNVLIHHIIDELRKEKKYSQNIPLTEDHEISAGTDVNIGESGLLADDLLKLLQQLPEVTGKVFNLYAIDGYKHNEIANLLGMSENTSKWHVGEARKRLKILLESQIATETLKTSR